MTNKKILWVTGFNKDYFNYVFKKTQSSWSLIPDDVVFLLDENILELSKDAKSIIIDMKDLKVPKTISGNEIKFWKKSRSIVYALEKFKKNYDYLIWLDSDISILKTPDTKLFLPNEEELLSVANKIVNYDKTIDKFQNPYLVDLGLDTGFIAFNLKFKHFENWLQEYKNFWETDEINQFVRKYDTYVLDRIIETNGYNYRNLWLGQHTKGKYYCGFEDTILEDYFYHYWGRKQKDNLK